MDPALLYTSALGEYDLSLAYMVVASWGGKDPAETLGELQAFSAIEPEPYRQAKIDLHLGRHEAALAHLAQCGPERFPEALQLAASKGLLRDALALYSGEGQARTPSCPSNYRSVPLQSMFEYV